jgi:hypothetical protein
MPTIDAATANLRGELRVELQSAQLFQYGFDTSTLDVTNVWKAPSAAGGGVAATNALTNTVLGTGTTISGYSYLESAVTFPPVNPGWLLFYTGINLPFPILVNQYFFWGLGSSPATPTAALPLTNACGFEVATTGKMYAVTYQSGTRVQIADLSTSGNGKQPLDAAVHKYFMYYRGDNIFWCIDNQDNVVAYTTTGAPGPDVNIMPIKFQAVAGAVAPLSSGLLQVNTVTLADTAGNNIQLADATYPWRQNTIDANGNFAVVIGPSSAASSFHLISAATTNATSVKATTGQVYGYDIYNANAAVRFVKLYNKATAPTVGTDIPVRTIGIPPASRVSADTPYGIGSFPLGIALATTTVITDADATAVAAGDLAINLDYK